MRLYRGFRFRYRPEHIEPSRFSGTGFLDCPALALLYARGPRGELLVVDIDIHVVTVPPRISRASDDGITQGYTLWGRFDDCISAIFAGRDLRGLLQDHGHRDATRAAKARFLRVVIDDVLQERAICLRVARRVVFTDRLSPHEDRWVISRER